METLISQETEVKQLLTVHIEWLTNLWGDLQTFEKLESQSPEAYYSETLKLIWEAIELEQKIITNIRRGNYEGV